MIGVPEYAVRNVRRVTAKDFPVWMTPDGKRPPRKPTTRRKP